jgi:hypothetical protein
MPSKTYWRPEKKITPAASVTTPASALRQRALEVDLISDVLPFGRLWYGKPNAASNAIGYAQHRSRSHGRFVLAGGSPPVHLE